MEKIKHAIEESKKSRLKNEAIVYSKDVANKRQDHDETKVAYEFTRVVSLDPENLKENRIVSFRGHKRALDNIFYKINDLRSSTWEEGLSHRKDSIF